MDQMNQLELGKFIGETTAQYAALDTRIAGQGRAIREDMDVIRGDIAGLRGLVESKLNGHGYRKKIMWGGIGGGIMVVLEAARMLAS